MIAVIHKAFLANWISFEVHLVDIFPISGDFKFVEKSTGVEMIVETKGGHCIFNLDQEEGGFMNHVQYPYGVRGRLIFSWKAQWDYIYTTNALCNKDEALFIPRDVIPPTWWNARPPHDQRLTWPSDHLDVLRQFIVHLTPCSQLVADIEGILRMRKRLTGSMQAQHPVQLKSIQEMQILSGCDAAFEAAGSGCSLWAWREKSGES